MKQVFTVLAALTVFAGGASAVEPGEPGPAFEGVDLDGNPVSYPEMLDGKPTVVVFWATWCPYCKAFMPHLEPIQEEFGEDSFNILTINAKERGAGDPAEYIDSLGFPVMAVAEGDAIAEEWGVHYIPGLIIVEGDGTVYWQRESTELPAGRKVAEFWESQVREQLAQLL